MKINLRTKIAKTLCVCIIMLSVSQLWAQAPVVDFEAKGDKKGCDLLVVNFTNKTTGATSYRWDFGDGGAASTEANPTKAYMYPGVYSVTLTASNASGSKSKTISNYITVYANPKPSFAIAPTEGCVPVTATFENTSTASAPITSTEWSFGDGKVASTSATTLTHSYTNANVYTVSMTMEDANGCQGTYSQAAAVEVHPLPRPDFTVTPSESCEVPATVAFSSITPGRIESFEWDFGDGNTAIGNNIAHTYTTKGMKTISLKVSDANGCVGTIVKPNAANIATFEADFTSKDRICINTAYTFVNNNPGKQNVWFIDGVQHAVTTNFTRTFDTDGTYEIKLVATNEAGCEKEVMKTVRVTKKPEVDIISADTDDHLCMDVNEHIGAAYEIDEIENDSGEPFVNWEWEVTGDKDFTMRSNVIQPRFNYPQKGTYTMKMRVRDAVCGWSSWAVKTIVVDEPIAMIIKEYESSLLPSKCMPANNQFNVGFRGHGEVIGGNVASWKWEIQDWTDLNAPIEKNTQNTNHTYTDTGLYVVTLSIEDEFGCKNEVRDSIGVGKKIDPAKIDFITKQEKVCYKDPITFESNIDLVKKEWTALEWHFYSEKTSALFAKRIEDADFSVLQDEITYDKDSERKDSIGVFGVQLTPIQYECKSDPVLNHNFQTIFAPKAEFLAPTEVCTDDEKILFEDLSIGALTYEWNFGDGVKLTVDSVDTKNKPKERKWVWSSNNKELLEYQHQWRTADGLGSSALQQTGSTWFFEEIHDEEQTGVYYKYKDYGIYNPQQKVFNDTVNNCKKTTPTCDGCEDSWTQQIVVTKVTIGLETSDTEFCKGEVLQLRDKSTCGLTSANVQKWVWDFGDGNSTSTARPSGLIHPPVGSNAKLDSVAYKYANAGKFKLRLEAEDNYGCSSTIEKDITVWETPTAIFTAPTQGCANQAIELTDNSTPVLDASLPVEIQTWQWAFEGADSIIINKKANGNYEWYGSNERVISKDTTSKDPSYIYRNSGRKAPKLTVIDVRECANTWTSTGIDVTKVVANFALRDTLALPGADYCHYGNVQLHNASTTSKWRVQSTWDLGDKSGPVGPFTNANIPSQKPVDFNYADKVNITQDTSIVVKLTVKEIQTGSIGCEDTVSKVVKISRPVSKFTADETSIDCPPLHVNFVDQSTTNIVSWAWEFGDNTTASILQNPKHTYVMPGGFAVALTVVDEFGCEDTHVEDPFINVDGPTGVAKISNAAICVPFSIDFTAKDLIKAESIRWIFGDGNAETIDNPSAEEVTAHIYKNGATFEPLLQLTDAKGCVVNVRTHSIDAREIVPDFMVQSPIACEESLVEFIDMSVTSHPITTWRWVLENINTGFKQQMTEQNPSLLLPFGIYKVRLEALIGGCGEEIVRDSVVQVYAVPTAAMRTLKDTVNMFEQLRFINESIPVEISGNETFYKWNFGDNTAEKTTFDAAHMFSRSGIYDVGLSAYEHENCADVAMKTIYVLDKNGLPNIFTPNGDGVNDVYLEDLGFKNIIILNRWGQKMYEGVEGWDGMVFGTEAAPGTYFYIVTPIVGDVLKGAFTLLRD